MMLHRLELQLQGIVREAQVCRLQKSHRCHMPDVRESRKQKVETTDSMQGQCEVERPLCWTSNSLHQNSEGPNYTVCIRREAIIAEAEEAVKLAVNLYSYEKDI